MTKEELALEVIERLKKEYPLAQCTLDYDQAWKRCLLVGKNDKPTREAVSWLLKWFAGDRANRGMNLFVDCNSME